LLDVEPEDEDGEGGNVDLDSQVKGKCAVIKTSTRQVNFVFLTTCSQLTLDYIDYLFTIDWFS
jgi:hypothetical protein